MRRFLLFCLCAVCFFPAKAFAVELTVYTALEAKLLRQYQEAFAKKHPDITLRWVRDSTGPITARLLAEQDAPKADVVFGLALTALLNVEKAGVLDGYTPPSREILLDRMFDKRKNPVWMGLSATGGALCVNTVELKRYNLPMPTSWQDLTKKEYKGHVLTASPAASGIALMNMNSWMAIAENEDAAYDFMSALTANMPMFVSSGCKPCQLAAIGETVIGIAAFQCSRPYIARKAPLAVVTPTEGIGWDVDAAALVAKSPHRAEALLLMDFISSPEASAIALDNGCIPARKDMLTPEAETSLAAFLPISPEETAAARQTRVKAWREKFESGK